MTGEALYDRIYGALEDGKIGTVTVPWHEVPGSEKLEWDRIASGGADCTAEIRHGPGHQSRTTCELKGLHDVHRAIYGSYRQEATWRGLHAYTGIADEPPLEDDEEDQS